MSPDDDLLREQYGRSVDEYRFQVDLNWRRSQAYFVLCAGVLAAAFALLTGGNGVPRVVGVLAFAASFIITVVAAVASHTQQRYYRAARNQVLALESRLGLEDAGLRTTPGMGAVLGRRFAKVTTLQNVVFATLACVNVGGAVAAADGLGSDAREGGTRLRRFSCTPERSAP